MVPYARPPRRFLRIDGLDVASFVDAGTRAGIDAGVGELNADAKTVSSFGAEWNRFASFTDAETRVAGDEVFDLVTPDVVNRSTVALDIGCGSGRWSRYLAPRVRFIEAVDPGEAVRAAARLTRPSGNIRVTQAGFGALPFAPGSFDLVFSLGVVHHLPGTEQAIREAASMLKPGGSLLLYIYYDLDGRGLLFRSLFRIADACRRVVSTLPTSAKFVVCDLLAVFVYLPLVGLARLVRAVGIGS
jgi:SAM-dependent methyltransferase